MLYLAMTLEEYVESLRCRAICPCHLCSGQWDPPGPDCQCSYMDGHGNMHRTWLHAHTGVEKSYHLWE